MTYKSISDLELMVGKDEDIREYQSVFNLIKQLQEDIYTDTMYPNDLRPAENHGYKTEYKGRGSLDI